MAENASAPQRRRRAPREKPAEGSAPATDATDAAPAPAANAEAARGRGRGRGRGGRGRGRGGRAPNTEGRPAAAEGAAPAPREPRAPGEPQPQEVFIRNLPRELKKDGVAQVVAGFGEVLKLRLIRSFGRLNAHLKFDSEENAQKAITGLEGKSVDGREIHASVYEKRERAPRVRKPRAAAAAAGESAPAGATAAPRRAKKTAEEKAAAAKAPREPREPRPVDPKVLWFGNLPENLPEADLTAKFGGKAVKEIAMRRHYAKATFDTEDDANAVFKAFEGLKIGENEVKVEVARPSRPPKRRRTPKPGNTNPLKIYIGKLPEGYQDNVLSGLFTGVTQLETHDRFAYLTFDTEANAQAAVAKNNTALLGGDLLIPVAVARR